MSEKVKSYITSHWNDCIKENREDKDTLIGMPYPYIVPSVGYFDEMYYWDTFFTNKGLALSGRFDQVKYNTDNMLYMVEKYGFMPNGNRTYYLTRSQPPFLSAMVYDVYSHYKDKAWLRGAYLTLKKEYDFWMTKRIAKNGLNVYGSHNYTDGLLEYSVGQLGKRIGFMPEGNTRDLGYHTLAVCESGWDICSRWGFELYNYNPVDLNSLMYLFESNMQYFSTELGVDEEEAWRNAAKKRKNLMLEYMDNGDGVLLDYNFISDTRSDVFSVASFYPMFVGLLDECRAKTLVLNLNRLEARYGVCTTEKNVIKGAYQWGYPNGWACLQYITVFALQKYGFADDARRIAEKYIELVDKIFDDTNNLWEKYNVIDGSIEVVDEYKMPTMMGWSAGVYLAAVEFLEKGIVL